VYLLRLPDIRTTFQQDQRSHQSGVHAHGSTPPVLGAGAYFRARNVPAHGVVLCCSRAFDGETETIVVRRPADGVSPCLL
jgi:hypothetical protein